MPATRRTRSLYAPESVATGIVHIGLGAFHRAHQAWYIERWLNSHRGGPWGICAANIRSNRQVVEQLQAQQGRYHVVAWSDRNNAEVTEVRSIREALFAGDDKSGLLERLTHPATRIVSLTVTEKAYCLSPATGELSTDDPGIRHDLDQHAAPRTVPGLLTEALRRRREKSLSPFTVLCCDNMPDNGERTLRAVTALAAERDPALADWIRSEVPFPSTMVDRIVPAVTDQMRRDMTALIGSPDPAAVACEAFTQWVVEDRFASGRPDWESVGVEMVSDVAPFEIMKLRMLNGAHSLLAYVGLAMGRRTVSEAIADPTLNTLVRDYFTETAPTLAATPGTTPENYAGQLLARFANDALEHQLSQIAMDGSQKIPQRWLHGAAANLASGRPIRATALGIAAWFSYVRGRNDEGATWQVDDPLAQRLRACHDQHTDARDIAAALLAISDVFPQSLAERPQFRAAVLEAFRQMTSDRKHCFEPGLP